MNRIKKKSLFGFVRPDPVRVELTFDKNNTKWYMTDEFIVSTLQCVVLAVTLTAIALALGIL